MELIFFRQFILSLPIVFFSSFLLSAQDTVVIHHHWYTSIYIKSRHIPMLVEFELTKEMLSCREHIRRTNKFTVDPDLPEASKLNNDYKHSGYDRGHNMSAQDNECEEEGMKECFYFTNMFPQTHSLNAGPWEKLEKHERQEAIEEGKIKVFIGSLGEKARIGPHRVVVPAFCWKVIYKENTKEYECYLMPNQELGNPDYMVYKVTSGEIEKKSGIRFQGDKALIHSRGKIAY